MNKKTFVFLHTKIKICYLAPFYRKILYSCSLDLKQQNVYKYNELFDKDTKEQNNNKVP